MTPASSTPPSTIPGVILAAPASGSGKTVLTLGLMRALTRAGVRVAPAKVGPDYIDPAFHAAACGRASINLDPWAMRVDSLAGLVAGLSIDADIALIEGVMGLFDGAADGRGATADLAAASGWPVILILDVTGQGASAVAVLQGLAAHREDVAVAGVILNRVGSDRHADLIANALQHHCPDIPLLGAVPRDARLDLPSRHLGLVQAGEHGGLSAFLDGAADVVGEALDLDALVALARPSGLTSDKPVPFFPPPGERIAVARDDAFAFCYPHLMDAWRAAGAELHFFSPLAGQGPDAQADAIYLPGGYPELHGPTLAGSADFLEGLRHAATRGVKIFGECGGYMVLGQQILDAQGRAHAMAGLLPLVTSFQDRRLHLGYRRAEVLADCALAPRGAALRAHEFHYASVVTEGPGAPLFHLRDARNTDLGAVGLVDGSVAGSFLHLIDRAPEEGETQ